MGKKEARGEIVGKIKQERQRKGESEWEKVGRKNWESMFVRSNASMWNIYDKIKMKKFKTKIA